MEEPGGLQSMGLRRVGHNWATSFHVHFHALEKEMATHSSVLAWRIPGTGEPGGLPSIGSHRVRHDWSDLAAAAAAFNPIVAELRSYKESVWPTKLKIFTTLPCTEKRLLTSDLLKKGVTMDFFKRAESWGMSRNWIGRGLSQPGSWWGGWGEVSEWRWDWALQGIEDAKGWEAHAR